MRAWTPPAIFTICVVIFAYNGLAQNEPPKPGSNAEFYRLDFVLKETDNGKPVTSRNYQMMVPIDDQRMSSIRSGGRVPVKNESGFQYVDVGVNIDVRRLNHTQDGLSLEVVAEISGAVDANDSQISKPGPPIIRQAKWNSIVFIPVRKPVVIFSADDPGPKRQLQLEVTATPVNR